MTKRFNNSRLWDDPNDFLYFLVPCFRGEHSEHILPSVPSGIFNVYDLFLTRQAKFNLFCIFENNLQKVPEFLQFSSSSLKREGMSQQLHVTYMNILASLKC